MDKKKSSKFLKNIPTIASAIEYLQKNYPEEIKLSFKDQHQLFAKYGWYIYDGTILEDDLDVKSIQELIKEYPDEELDAHTVRRLRGKEYIGNFLKE